MDTRKDMTEGSKPTRVPGKAKPVGEIQDRWLWVEPSVWTTRMLTALEQGVKGGVWFSLIDKVASKKLFEMSGIPTAPWQTLAKACPPEEVDMDVPLVVNMSAGANLAEV